MHYTILLMPLPCAHYMSGHSLSYANAQFKLVIMGEVYSELTSMVVSNSLDQKYCLDISAAIYGPCMR